MKTSKCIYCKAEKDESDFSLEHITPQFLGGAQAPDNLKTRSVCKTCNNNLGLFVDAAFEKDFLVFNELNSAAFAYFNPEAPIPLPLQSLGNSDLIPPEIKEDEICECWIGPLGEQVYWIRPKDERMYWYAGGNPRTVKKVKTRAYFMWAERSQKAPIITWLTFRDAFLGRNVKKIMLTKVEGADPKDIGFSDPDELDIKRMGYFRSECSNRQEQKSQIAMYLDFDIRFMAKLAIGLSHALFENQHPDDAYSKELLKALWFKEGDDEPKIKISTNLGGKMTFLKEHCGVTNGTTITILPTHESIAINLNLNRKMNWVIECIKIESINHNAINELGSGICIVLYKHLKKCIKLSLPELIAHNSGKVTNPELSYIEELAGQHSDYFKTL